MKHGLGVMLMLWRSGCVLIDFFDFFLKRDYFWRRDEVTPRQMLRDETRCSVVHGQNR